MGTHEQKISFHFKRANTNYNNENYHEAISLYSEAIALLEEAAWFYEEKNHFHYGITLPTAYRSRADCYRLIGEYEKAVSDCTKSIEIDPDNELVWAVRGDSYRGIKEYDKAIADLTVALELNPQYAFALSCRGWVSSLVGEYEKAIDDFTHALGITPNDFWVLARRGQVYSLQKNYPAAIRDLEQAMQLAPNVDWIQQAHLEIPLEEKSKFTTASNNSKLQIIRSMISSISSASQYDYLSIEDELSHLVNDKTMRLFIEALDSPDYVVRMCIVETLGKAKNRLAVEPLVNLLKRETLGFNRYNIAEALRAFGWEPETPEEKVAYWCAMSDLQVGRCLEIGESAIQPLLDIVKRDPTIWKITSTGSAKQFFEVLTQLGWQPSSEEEWALYYITHAQWDDCIRLGASVIPLLIRYFDYFDAPGSRSTDLNRMIITVMSEIGDKRAIPCLARLLGEDHNLQYAIVEALDKLEWEPDISEAAMVYWITKENIRKCVEIGEPAVKPLLAIASRRGITPFELRRSAVKALVSINSTIKIDSIISAIEEDERELQAIVRETESLDNGLWDYSGYGIGDYD